MSHNYVNVYWSSFVCNLVQAYPELKGQSCDYVYLQ